jgi:hypothetical protein
MNRCCSNDGGIGKHHGNRLRKQRHIYLIINYLTQQHENPHDDGRHRRNENKYHWPLCKFHKDDVC